MMGPASFDKRYPPGALVSIKPKSPLLKKRSGQIGTVIDNYVNFNIMSGNRTEKVLVMWPDSITKWYLLDHVEPAE